MKNYTRSITTRLTIEPGEVEGLPIDVHLVIEATASMEPARIRYDRRDYPGSEIEIEIESIIAAPPVIDTKSCKVVDMALDAVISEMRL